MSIADNEMSQEMAQAIRDVVNFSRFDERYVNLSRFDRNAARSEYFEERFAEIAELNGVDKKELRHWLMHFVKPESFGLEVREYNGQEYVAKM